MNEFVVLKAIRRAERGKSVKQLRRQGFLPGIMYGHHLEPIAISLNAHEAGLILAGISASTVVDIDLEGERHAALVREKQADYLRNKLLHVDFQVVSLTEKIASAVPIDLTGTAPVVREMSAVLVSNLSQVEVEALPRDLPERITVDVSSLENIGDAIYVRDLNVADTVEILTDADEVVVVATGAAMIEEEEEEVTEEMEEPEIIERGKKEDEEE